MKIIDLDGEKKVTADQLYFAGKLIHGKAIDYDYIAAMEDISHAGEICRKQALKALAAAGFLEEDFDGSITVTKLGIDFLEPVFNGQIELTADLQTAGEKTVYRIHGMEGRYTFSKELDRGVYLLRSGGIKQVHELFEMLFPVHSSESGAADTVKDDVIEDVCVIRCKKGELETLVAEFGYSGTAVYLYKWDGTWKRTTRDHALETVSGMLRAD